MSSVAKRAPEFAAREGDWALMRDFVSGCKAVKSGNHIARLPGHDDETYKRFKERAYYLGAAERSVEGLTGLIFRKEPQADWPKAFNDYAEDITRDGKSARQLSSEIAGEVLTVGMCGVLIDHPPQGVGLMQAQKEAMGVRPYARLYTVENILGVKEVTRGADRVLQQVRLMETARAPKADDEFAEETVERVRVLSLDEAGHYFVRLFEKQKNAKGDVVWVEIVDPFYPLRNNQKLTEIPFRLFTRKGHISTPPKPPLLDLAEANRGHVNDSALYQWGLMWTANPTPCFVDLQLGEGEKVSLGASKGLTFGENGNAFFLEFGGAGLGAIRQAMEDKRRDMATLGARMLADDRKGVEAAETARIHRSGENSILASIASSISEGMVWVLDAVAQWAKIAGEISYKLNTDFIAAPMDAQTMTALMGLWQGGGITSEDLFLALQRGEVIRENKTAEEHSEQLETEPAPLAAVPAE